MIWLLYIGSLLLGIMLIRFTYMLEKKRHEKERLQTEKQMKEFMDMLNKKKNEN